MKWLELAAEYQMRDAARELAEIYQDGLGNVSQNLEKAKEFYLLAKESGENVERSVQQLQSRLAVRDDFGALLELAKEGNLEAQKDLAMAYVRGDEIEQNYEEAFNGIKLPPNKVMLMHKIVCTIAMQKAKELNKIAKRR